MRTQILGKAHKTGTSKKTGQPYDFIELHLVGPDPYGQVEGLSCQTLTLPPNIYPYDRIVPGEEYDLEFGFNGRIVGFMPVKG